MKKLIEYVRIVATEKPQIKIFGQWIRFVQGLRVLIFV
jgi:hypothetical protein